MIKQEKVKLLLKYAEQYGFNVSKSHILTKNGNVQRDSTWRDYIIGITEVKKADGIYERGTQGVFDITVTNDLFFYDYGWFIDSFSYTSSYSKFCKTKILCLL